mmetsp:Transcript_23048/g.36705  ORF Transcript_23048/g.36705 Transcript_23048/m.36705 type:complete len:271 (+) Transcript_23048:1276-2088(+)
MKIGLLAALCGVAVARRQFRVKEREYVCREQEASRKCLLLDTVQDVQHGENKMSLEQCMMLCEKMFWPMPTNTSISFDAAPVRQRGGSVRFNKVPRKARGLMKQFYREFTKHHGRGVDIEFDVHSADVTLGIDTNEGYIIHKVATSARVIIKANTVFGARNALETLGQMVVCKGRACVIPREIDIQDRPAYPYRGIMLDLSRNFIEVEVIKNTIRAMAMNKLNTLHLHITDTASFPMEFKSHPELAEYGAYSRRKVYRHSDLRRYTGMRW